MSIHTQTCTQSARHTQRSAISHLNDSVVDGSVLLLSQHHQGDDNHGCYNDTSNHQANNGTLVGAHIFSKEDLWEVKGQDNMTFSIFAAGVINRNKGAENVDS